MKEKKKKMKEKNFVKLKSIFGPLLVGTGVRQWTLLHGTKCTAQGTPNTSTRTFTLAWTEKTIFS